MKKLDRSKLQGVWSAAPTPFDSRMRIDREAVRRMVEHHVRLGVNGLFLAGTNGEGPWITNAQRRQLVADVVRYAKGRLLIAVQVTDNSAARILDNMAEIREDGADIAVIAQPFFSVGGRPNLLDFYRESIRKSPLPVGIYDRGPHVANAVPDDVMRKILMEKKVVLLKDSSGDPKRRALLLAVRRRRPELRLLNGDEFQCVSFLTAGYDGLLLGGGVFNGFIAGQLLAAVRAGDLALAEKLQARMNRIMYDVYGGPKITCWLSGEKKLLVGMGILRSWKNHLGYPLTPSCKKAIARVLKRDRDILFP